MMMEYKVYHKISLKSVTKFLEKSNLKFVEISEKYLKVVSPR